MSKVFPSMQWISSLLISAFLLGTASCGIVSASRLLYSASQEGQFPSIYSMLNDHHSPVVASTQIVILSSVPLIFSSIIYLVKYISLGASCIHLLEMIGLLKLRYQNPDLPRPYKVSQYVNTNVEFCLVQALWYSSNHLQTPYEKQLPYVFLSSFCDMTYLRVPSYYMKCENWWTSGKTDIIIFFLKSNNNTKEKTISSMIKWTHSHYNNNTWII